MTSHLTYPFKSCLAMCSRQSILFYNSSFTSLICIYNTMVWTPWVNFSVGTKSCYASFSFQTFPLRWWVGVWHTEERMERTGSPTPRQAQVGDDLSRSNVSDYMSGILWEHKVSWGLQHTLQCCNVLQVRHMFVSQNGFARIKGPCYGNQSLPLIQALTNTHTVTNLYLLYSPPRWFAA